MTNDSKPKFFTACPYCYEKDPNPKGPRNYLDYDPDRPGELHCKDCGWMPKSKELADGPKFCFTHYEMPKEGENHERTTSAMPIM